MDAYKFETLSRSELLELCKQKGLKADRKATKLDFKIAPQANEEVQRCKAVSEEEDEVDDNEKKGTQIQNEKREELS
ncbi:hypothetical protein NDU88_000565 [Pleurodeles waltl]|uniref:Uncharacterized protein n=1 Tax=Pleurodeles waltl TaxID=8319 RepID=A0AAV7PA24_PLEWA|nr:hypothetical protein NDU88_000565 [Pleurodeles waltl]